MPIGVVFAYGQQAGPIADDYIRDPDYLKKRNINVIDRDGKVIDQSLIDWVTVSRRPFSLGAPAGTGVG